MSSLEEYFSPLVGFFSYSREDDENSRDALSNFREAIQKELSDLLGRSRQDFRIWQDRFAIAYGEKWKEEINQGISESAFFIPIITPRAIKRPYCAFEFKSFLAREADLGRNNLIFPILYIQLPELDDDRWRGNSVLEVVKERQYFDFRDLRLRPPNSVEVRESVAKFCQNIANALREPWEPVPESRPKQEAKRTAEQEPTTETADIAATPSIIETPKQSDARKAARAKVRRRAEEKRKKAAPPSAQDDEDTKQAVEAIGQPESAQGGRQEATRADAGVEVKRVVGSTPPSAQEANTFPSPRAWPRLASKPMIATAAVAAALIAAAFGYWLEPTPLPERQVASASPAAAPSHPPAIPLTEPPAASPSPSAAINRPPSTSPLASQPAKATDGAPSKVEEEVLRRTASQSGGTSSLVGPPVVVPQPLGPPSPMVPRPPTASSPRSTVDVAPVNLACQLGQTSAEQKSHGTGGPLSAQDLVTLTLTTKPQEIRSIAISPDGTQMVTGGDDSIIRVWDAVSLKWIRDVRGQHTAAVYSVAYSADGSLVASASWDGTVRIWDAHSFALVQTFNADDGGGWVKQNAVAFEPTSRPRYVDSAGEDGNVWIWDLQNPTHFRKWSDPERPPSPVRSLSFAPDKSGALVTASYDGNIRFFSASRKISAQAATTGHRDKLLHVAYSPDGSLVASGGVDTGYQILKIWNATNQTFKGYQGNHNYAASTAWSADGKAVAVGEGGRYPSVEVVDLQSGVKLKVFSGHAWDVESVVFHPNKKWLISGSEDGMVKIWDLAGGTELLTLVGLGNEHLAYAPTGCYTGSANAASYVRYVKKDDQGRELDAGSAANLFVPGDTPAALLPR